MISRAVKAWLSSSIKMIIANVSNSWEPSTVDTDKHEHTLVGLAAFSVSLFITIDLFRATDG